MTTDLLRNVKMKSNNYGYALPDHIRQIFKTLKLVVYWENGQMYSILSLLISYWLISYIFQSSVSLCNCENCNYLHTKRNSYGNCMFDHSLNTTNTKKV